MILSTRETSPSKWRAGLAEASSVGDSYADAASVEASGLKTVFERRVRLTVLRATGLAQVRNSLSMPPLFRQPRETKTHPPPVELVARCLGISSRVQARLLASCFLLRWAADAIVPNAKGCTFGPQHSREMGTQLAT